MPRDPEIPSSSRDNPEEQRLESTFEAIRKDLVTIRWMTVGALIGVLILILKAFFV